MIAQFLSLRLLSLRQLAVITLLLVLVGFIAIQSCATPIEHLRLEQVSNTFHSFWHDDQTMTITPSTAPVGTEVTISGAGIKEAMGVTFNGAPAQQVTIDSETQLRVLVPDGATDGPIEVQLPTHVLTSTVAFVLLRPQPGIWISPQEIAALPTTGPAWEQLKTAADQPVGTPDLSNQDDMENTTVLAKALVFARLQDPRYRQEVAAALQSITDQKSEENGRTLALGRELVAYVVAANLIDLRGYDPALNQRFEERLRELLTKKINEGGAEPASLRETHENRPNNWGGHAGASRAAIARYLGDYTELERTAQVFHGYLGNRASYSGFDYGADLSWQFDPTAPVGINPIGAQKEGHSIDGAQPEEMRRGGKFRWPPKRTNYAWGALQGSMVQAVILHRAGYPVWEWEDQALLRAVKFLYSIDWQPEGDDQWLVWLVNSVYGTEYPTKAQVNPGKNMAWTNWTHAK